MALLVEYKCEQTIPKHITIKYTIKHIRDMSNKHKQDIKTNERQREQSQTPEICFEVRAPLLYVPAFNTMKDFHYKRSHRITWCRNTYNDFTLELFGLTSPSLVPARTTHRKHTSLPRPHLYTKLSLELEITRNRKSASSNTKQNTLVITTL